MAEAEIAITDGLLAGLSVSGIQIWSTKDDPKQMFVKFPARPYGDGPRYREYLRATDGKGNTAKAVRELILAAFKESDLAG